MMRKTRGPTKMYTRKERGLPLNSANTFLWTKGLKHTATRIEVIKVVHNGNLSKSSGITSYPVSRGAMHVSFLKVAKSCLILLNGGFAL